MAYLLDLFYLLALIVASPWLLFKALTTGKYRRGVGDKFFGLFQPVPDSPCLPVSLSRRLRRAWFHGVSVGEIHLLRQVVARFRQAHADWSCVISTTTDTGYEQARRQFPDLPVIFWPLDFSWAVRRTMNMIDPALVVLAEGELWPNFMHLARKRRLPVAVVNGRMSPRSFRRYHAFRSFLRPIFKHLDLAAVQTDEYAHDFRVMGVRVDRVHVTGSVKYDGVTTERGHPKTRALGSLLNVQAADVVWVAGSTQAPEEQIVLDIFRRIRTEQANLRLFLVPRQKERFEEVAGVLRRSGLLFLRRSELKEPVRDRSAVILVDTIGELGALWGLADVAFVGGSLDGKRGGQNMIEPAAYGAAVVFGPHVWNFHDAAARLVESSAALQVTDADGLETAIRRLLDDPRERQRLGAAAQQLVRYQQGATQRTIECLDRLIGASGQSEHAA